MGRVQFVVNDTAKKVIRKGGKGKLSGKCDVCGKIPGFGHNVSHSARKTNRMWMPNIQHKMIQLKGETAPVKRNICTQCMRTLQKDRV
jgi:large subunit ribosomal protein L28